MPAWMKLQTGIAASDEGGGGDGEGGGGDGGEGGIPIFSQFQKRRQ